MDDNINSNILKKVLIITIIASIVITFFTRLNIDNYIKYAIIPIISIITSYTIFASTLDIKLNKKSYIYLIYIFLILISYFIIPLAEVNKYLNIIVVPILTSIYIFSLINPNYHLNLNFLRWFTKLIPGYLFSNTEYINTAVKETKIQNNKIKDIIKGLLIGIPIIIVLLLLLSHGDVYFSSFIHKIFSSINFELNIDSLIETCIILVLSFIFVFSTCINLYQMRKANDFKYKSINVSNTITYIILGLVNFVYILFLISEISKLTTNFLNVPLEYTYANYAREGFFELLGVSTINFIILIFYLNYAKVNNKWIKRLLMLIIIFSIFIIFNSYYRMGLYIFEYGFTVLRLQVILFLALELVFFIFLTLKLNDKLKKTNNIKYLIIMLVTYFLNVYICNEMFINFINNL